MEATITMSRALAQTINNVFLPANPKKMRSAHPDTINAAQEFKAALTAPATQPSRTSLTSLEQEMLDALLSAEGAVEQLCQGQIPENECWNTLRSIRTAIAKARGEA